MLGRSGTGKKTILKITASLNKMELVDGITHPSEALYQCYKNKEVILMEEYMRRNYAQFIEANKSTVFSQMKAAASDE